MSYYGMDTEQVQTVGARVFALEPEADTAVRGVLTSYMDASGTVHHPLVRQAMSTFHDTHQRGHLALPEAVRGLGSNTANGGAAIADGNNEAANVQQQSLSSQEALVRDINQPLQQ